MQTTPYGLRTHIGILGRRNSGKSSLLNAITHQKISIVSEKAGTTTDPVQKRMELTQVGPVVFYDTAGLDDTGKLGQSRIQKTNRIIDRLDIAILVAVADQWGEFEERLIKKLESSDTPLIVAFNKADVALPDGKLTDWLIKHKLQWVKTIATEEKGINELRQLIINTALEKTSAPRSILGDLVTADDMVILVTPIDSEAPQGRLILPQVQVIRDLLDNNAGCIVVKENRLKNALNQLKVKPRMVITDSQAFKQVDADTPYEIPLTSFSILFARFKGDLQTFVNGVRTIETLRPSDKVLIAEACTHHPLEDDIGTVKIPRWLNQRIGGELRFTNKHGADFPDTIEELKEYKLVIHCGACNFSRRQMLNRIEKCKAAGVPITNYGITISYILDIFDRALRPFNII
ncbi:[FeFe] hydrogenase H-cluster maturation GTPase HydF [bacterium]|nr:[FeFe] hydrogenase H-cluster maturation GTPase HydF [bacterium]